MKLNKSNGRMPNLRGGFNPSVSPFGNPGKVQATNPQRPVKVDAIVGDNFSQNNAQKPSTLASSQGDRRKGRRRAQTQTQNQGGPSLYVGINFPNNDSSSSSEDFNSESGNNSRQGLFPERRSSALTFD